MTSKALYQATDDAREAETQRFSEGLNPSKAFLKRWKETERKRRIAGRLAKMRINAGYTQAEIAERTGIDPTYISKMESSTGPVPKAESIAQYAACCGYDTAYAFISRADGMIEFDLHNILRDEDEIVTVEYSQRATG